MRCEIIAIPRHGRIEINQTRNTIPQSIRNAGNHHPTIGMPNQNNSVQVARQNQICDFYDVTIKRSSYRKVQRWGNHLMSIGRKHGLHFVPAPSAEISAMD